MKTRPPMRITPSQAIDLIEDAITGYRNSEDGDAQDVLNYILATVEITTKAGEAGGGSGKMHVSLGVVAVDDDLKVHHHAENDLAATPRAMMDGFGLSGRPKIATTEAAASGRRTTMRLAEGVDASEIAPLEELYVAGDDTVTTLYRALEDQPIITPIGEVPWDWTPDPDNPGVVEVELFRIGGAPEDGEG